ncbi:MAG: DUF4386 domain-containing protein [candidate division Zixibacteria bacterium]|nr:DUF4386 domain-containing protein [candidate division Zixibacteria bacterium]
MTDIKKTARVAGVLYMLMVITGLFTLMYVPGKLIVKGNPAETASRILAHESLYRIDLAVGLAATIIFMFTALVLYHLLKETNPHQAAVMLILVLVQVPQSFVTQLLQIGALELLRGADFLMILDKAQRETMAMWCLHLNDKSTALSEMFWGLWLFPLGWLVFRSGFLPRFLGIWLILNGVAYVLMSFTGLLLPAYAKLAYNIALPALLGELAFALWLLLVGARPKPPTTP